MLSIADNELLTRTGPGAPMGEVFRRFWVPALLSSELPRRGGPPVKAALLGEKLVAFRGADGRVGLLEARCPHRHANLYWGRNEGDGIRCVYHGWKFAPDGDCLDTPAEPPGSRYREHVGAVAYATHEAGGIIWAYLGPREHQPAFPDLEWTSLPPGWSAAGKRLQMCNWLQNVEGELDTAHVQFLHRELERSGGGAVALMSETSAPEYLIKQTPTGLLAIAQRVRPDGQVYWRITPFLLPSFTLVPSADGERCTFTAAVPVDDTRMWGFTVTWRHDRPFDDEDRANAEEGMALHVKVDPDTFLPVANMSNDYLIDRAYQETGNFTGIRGIRVQDLAVQEDQDGPICQRHEEHLGATDRALVATRRLLLRVAKDLDKGAEPPQAASAACYRTRSLAATAPAGVDWRELWRQAQPPAAPAAVREL